MSALYTTDYTIGYDWSVQKDDQGVFMWVVRELEFDKGYSFAVMKTTLIIYNENEGISND